MGMRIRVFAATLLVAAQTWSCGTSTEMASLWKDPAYTGQPQSKVLVVALTDNERNLRLWENGMMEALRHHGAIPLAGSAYIPIGSQPPDSTTVLGDIRKSGADLIMVSRLLGVTKEQEYVPGTTYYAPSPYYYGWYGYYSTAWGVVHQPGYYQTNTIVELETNVYDFPTSKLVWSGHSRTFNPSGANDVVNSVTQAVATELATAGVIKKK
jgi:hypothetical protein